MTCSVIRSMLAAPFRASVDTGAGTMLWLCVAGLTAAAPDAPEAPDEADETADETLASVSNEAAASGDQPSRPLRHTMRAAPVAAARAPS